MSLISWPYITRVGARGNSAAKIVEFRFEIDTPGDQPDKGHDNTVGKSLHDGAERRPEYYGDSQIEHISAGDKSFEIFPHRAKISLFFGCKAVQDNDIRFGDD
jgi:hypothetical protein